MFKKPQDIVNAVLANKRVYYQTNNYVVHKAVSGYNVYYLNKSGSGIPVVAFPLFQDDDKTIINGDMWNYFTDDDVNGFYYQDTIDMMDDEIKFLRMKLQEKEGIPTSQSWEPPKRYKEIK